MINLIVAINKNNGIGMLNKIPWRLPSDLRYFKEITNSLGSNSVIMGRKTWDSLPFKPLPGRQNIVLTTNPTTIEKRVDTTVATSFEDLEDKIKEIDCTNNWVIGGEDIYKYFINKPVRNLYITRVHNDRECDAFFPDIPSHFELKSRSEIKKENGEYFHYEVLQDPNYIFKVMN